MSGVEWNWSTERTPDGLRSELQRGGRAVSWRDGVEGWLLDETAREAWCASLCAVPWGALFWETPSVTEATSEAPMEQMLLPAPALETVHEDARTFHEHFRASSRAVAFASLGGDARLVAPCPTTGHVDHAHLVAFLRSAPPESTHALLKTVAEEALSRLSARPFWLSTSGLGVSWLHVRLDDRPKYYVHAPYRRPR